MLDFSECLLSFDLNFLGGFVLAFGEISNVNQFLYRVVQYFAGCGAQFKLFFNVN